MIDPQRQARASCLLLLCILEANKYIKNMGKDVETGFDAPSETWSSILMIKVCKMSETNFLRTLELGIQFGKWILLGPKSVISLIVVWKRLENIGLNLDPALEPILQQQKARRSFFLKDLWL